MTGGGGCSGRHVNIDGIAGRVNIGSIAGIDRGSIVLAELFKSITGRGRGVDQEDGAARARGGATLVSASDDSKNWGQKGLAQIGLGFVGWRGVVVLVILDDRVDSQQATGASTVFVMVVAVSCHGCCVRSKW